jgi:oxygen-dependent protoporphyrinogen oxidase
MSNSSFSQGIVAPRVAIIGGGISGLAAAWRLLELVPRCRLVVFDSRPRLGGVIGTVREDGFQVEQSADNFITTSIWGVALCQQLGLGGDLIGTNPAYRRVFVVRRGKLYRLPDGFLMMAPTRFWPLAVTPLLTPWGKLRAALEYLLPPRHDEADESMAAFVRRRLGREVFERLVEPLVSAVYAADMEKLSVLATLPRFREMERRHGSLIRAMRWEMRQRMLSGGETGQARESGARYGMFVTLRHGLDTLVETLAAKLPEDCARLQMAVEQLHRQGDRWMIRAGSRREEYDAVVVATPAHVAARLLRPLDPELAADLGSIEHSGTAIVSLGYNEDQLGHPLDGMGAVVPAIERSPLLAISFSSRKYANRAPPGKVLLRAFVGGARCPQLTALPEGELLSLVRRAVEALLGIRGDPCFRHVAHWPDTMPQYHVGHRDLVARVETRLRHWPTLSLAGNAYHGVGIPDCIHSGRQAAEQIARCFSHPAFPDLVTPESSDFPSPGSSDRSPTDS